MNDLSRRAAIGLGLFTGPAILATVVQAGEKRVQFVDENPVLFKIRNVTIDRVDEGARTIDVTLGLGEAPMTLQKLPLAPDIGIRVSFIHPGSVNNVPFDWNRLKGLIGKRVSMFLRAESSHLSVDSIAVNND